jgi:Ceramidase
MKTYDASTQGSKPEAMAKRFKYIIALTLLSVLAAFLIPAIPQPPEYHDFADNRAMFGVANFLNVASNIGFLLAGIAGLAAVVRASTQFEFRNERWPYAIFFVGLLLTAVGSSYYHLAPDNARLFWDRLPMTVAFMSLVAAQLVDRVSVRLGFALLMPMMLVGAASVMYWRVTEEAGVGNLVPYAILQVYSVLLVLLIAQSAPSRYTRGNDIYWVFAAYVVAKILELLDRQLLALGNLVSGHTLKHLAAAVAGLIVCRMLVLRTLREPVSRQE